MKKGIGLFVVLLLLCPALVTAFDGVPGATDRVRGASLIVPFFEVGVDSVANPHDTLLVVTRMYAAANGIIHYHVWDIDGNATDLNGNITLDAFETWSASMRNLISAASNVTKSQLTITGGTFYQGFVTIDRVTASTALAPSNSGFPFDDTNDIEGWTYYVRMLQGSSNGLPMISLEYVGSSVSSYLRDFYQNSDGREKIDADARYCASQLIEGKTCANHDEIYELNSRIFLDPSMNAKSRIIVFAWDPDRSRGLSTFCQTSGECDQAYNWSRYDEAGTEAEAKTVRLDHVVNVFNVQGTQNGWVSIWDIPVNAGAATFQIYGFSFNSASSSDESTNWDAIFESYIDLRAEAMVADPL